MASTGKKRVFPCPCCGTTITTVHPYKRFCSTRCNLNFNYPPRLARVKKTPEQKAQTKLATRIKKYGISLDQYQIMMEIQNGLCRICKRSTRRPLSVDHCHATGRVRGLLCHKCNIGLGNFEDDVQRLKNAVEYLSSIQN